MKYSSCWKFAKEGGRLAPSHTSLLECIFRGGRRRQTAENAKVNARNINFVLLLIQLKFAQQQYED
jgi:hypothetical protein